MKAYLQDLYRYNDWANQLYFPLLRAHPQPEIIRLYSHLINAHGIWLKRMTTALKSPLADTVPVPGVWDLYTAEEISALHSQIHTSTLQWIDEIEDFEQSYSYRNTQGVSYENSLRDTLIHVVNHSTYHRGQVAWLYRQEDIAPPSTDYIFYCRR